MEIGVPTPGTQDAAPEATSKRASSGSPFMSLHAPNPRPMTSPTTGTALAPVFPACFTLIRLFFNYGSTCGVFHITSGQKTNK